MLSPALLAQLHTHFSSLESYISLALYQSEHPKQEELRAMLSSVVSTSPHLNLLELEDTSPRVRFELWKTGIPTGIAFDMIPGGHEFTSLVLAILHVDGKGRWPDLEVQNHLQQLTGPIRLRTYLALSCTNCPDVVQALNQMALIHPDFEHTSIDGDLVPTEVTALGIQGVPAVFAEDRLVHSGKASFGELLAKLATVYALTPAPTTNHHDIAATNYDVAVLGAGPAGAAAALYLARKGLQVAVIAHNVGGQVNDTQAIENLVSQAQTTGPKLAADLRANLEAQSTIRLYLDRRIESIQPLAESHTAFAIGASGALSIGAQQIIIASGAQWRRLNIPGEADYIGRGVAFCPHCDGPFFAGKDVAVVGGGNSGIEAAIDLAGICRSVLVLEYLDSLKADQVLIDKARSLTNVTIHTAARTVSILGNGQSLKGLNWEERHSGTQHHSPLDGVFVQIGLAPNSAIFKDLVELNQRSEIIVDQHNRTSRPGIYAAGDVSSVPYKQIAIAFGEGAKAALTAFEDRLRQLS
jgi:NADH-dependent peroxiredoxin subunit F